MERAITVSQLNRYAKDLLEQDVLLQDLAVSGEISNFTNHFKTGHLYFSLKDETASVKAVMFRTDAQRLSFVPENGMKVLVSCRVSLYERDGAFQVYVRRMALDGQGAMQAAFEQLKKKLAAQGLFDAAHKKTLPQMPKAVGLVTSKTGAALQDILNVARRRCPMASFLLCPANVQGAQAAQQVTRAIQTLDASGKCDVIIVARGGGSTEDLWEFNNETLARAAYACRTPLVSAVGHEIDFTILDFVADCRAPTPSAAAEIVLPDMAQRIAAVRKTAASLRQMMHAKLSRANYQLSSCKTKASTETATTKIERRRGDLNRLRARAYEGMQNKTERLQMRLAHAAQMAESLNPYGVLARGYAFVQREPSAVEKSAVLTEGEQVTLITKQAQAVCTVNRVTAHSSGLQELGENEALARGKEKEKQ